jgi:hypothetical protein
MRKSLTIPASYIKEAGFQPGDTLYASGDLILSKGQGEAPDKMGAIKTPMETLSMDFMQIDRQGHPGFLDFTLQVEKDGRLRLGKDTAPEGHKEDFQYVAVPGKIVIF